MMKRINKKASPSLTSRLQVNNIFMCLFVNIFGENCILNLSDLFRMQVHMKNANKFVLLISWTKIKTIEVLSHLQKNMAVSIRQDQIMQKLLIRYYYFAMYQVTKSYKLAELTPERVPEAAKLLAKAFLRQNKIWNVLNFQFEKVEEYMTGKALEIIDWQNELRQKGIIGKNTFLNFIYLDQNDKIVVVNLNIELTQYLTKKSKFVFKQYNIFAKYFVQLEKSIDQRDKVPGLCFFKVFLAVDYSLMGIGVMLLFSIELSRYLHAEGFRKMYGTSTDIQTSSFIKRSGGQLASTFKFCFNNKKLVMSLVKISLQSLKYDYSLSAISTFNAKL